MKAGNEHVSLNNGQDLPHIVLNKLTSLVETVAESEELLN